MKIVGITACIAGIAHTYIAKEKLEGAARELGDEIKIETQGSIGIENALTPEDIAEADVVIIAVDIGITKDRFKGKPANDIEQIGNLERHNRTDELFILLNGSCTLVYAVEEGDGLNLKIVEMRPHAVYQIPPTLWHNTIMTKDAKLLLIENSDTSMENSDLRDLTKEEVSFLKNQIK